MAAVSGGAATEHGTESAIFRSMRAFWASKPSMAAVIVSVFKLGRDKFGISKQQCNALCRASSRVAEA